MGWLFVPVIPLPNLSIPRYPAVETMAGEEWIGVPPASTLTQREEAELHERLNGNPQTGDRNEERAGDGYKTEERSAFGNVAEEPARIDQCDADCRQHTCQPQAEHDNQRQPKGNSLYADRPQHQHQCGRAGQETPRDPQRQQAAPGDRRAIRPWREMRVGVRLEMHRFRVIVAVRAVMAVLMMIMPMIMVMRLRGGRRMAAAVMGVAVAGVCIPA